MAGSGNTLFLGERAAGSWRRIPWPRRSLHGDLYLPCEGGAEDASWLCRACRRHTSEYQKNGVSFAAAGRIPFFFALPSARRSVQPGDFTVCALLPAAEPLPQQEGSAREGQKRAAMQDGLGIGDILCRVAFRKVHGKVCCILRGHRRSAGIPSHAGRRGSRTASCFCQRDSSDSGASL